MNLLELLKLIFEGSLYTLGIAFIAYILFCMIRAFMQIFGGRDDDA